MLNLYRLKNGLKYNGWLPARYKFEKGKSMNLIKSIRIERLVIFTLCVYAVLTGYHTHAGSFDSQNSIETLERARKAAEQGHAEAQYNLGGFYVFGDGVKQDYAEAVKWYRKAAAQGDAQAISVLKKLGM